MMKKYMALFVLLFFFIAIAVFYKPIFPYPFKCYGFTEYNLMFEDNKVQLNLSQDLRVFDDQTGEISFNGRVIYNKKNMIFNRKIKLSDASRLDSNTFKFTIKNKVKSLTDNTPDEILDVLLDEYTASQHTLQIDLNEIMNGVWVISTPTSFISVCHIY